MSPSKRFLAGKSSGALYCYYFSICVSETAREKLTGAGINILQFHYFGESMKKQKITGDQLTETQVRRIMDKINITQSKCWEWQGALTYKGYATISIAGIQYVVHRLMWEYRNRRPMREGQQGCHKCDNRRCINPTHVYAGTPQTNATDKLIPRIATGKRRRRRC